MRRVPSGLATALLFLTTTAFVYAAEPPDWHVTSAVAQMICMRSTWLHGYMHGYEQGFHEGDLDLQLARDARDSEKIRGFRDSVGYQRAFGGKQLFREGYQEGFRVGYADSFTGRRFRALSALERAADGLQGSTPPVPNKSFDEGFATGYDAGRREGLREARNGLGLHQRAAPCGDHNGDYCDGYGRGFRMGYADGYVNQAPQAVAVR